MQKDTTRRAFLKSAGIALMFPMLLSSAEMRKSTPLVEIVDKDYKFKVLADNLKHPKSVVVSPVDGRVFVAQKNGRGSSESVYEIVDGKVEHRFPGAGDPWGGIQRTKLAVNLENKMFVYSRTYISSDIAVFDLKTGKRIAEIKNPFYTPPKHIERGDDNFIENVAVNPIDDKFYMSMYFSERLPIRFLDLESKTVKVKDTPKNLFLRSKFCFDSEGTLYFEDFRSLEDRSLKKIDGNGNIEKLVLPALEEKIGSPKECNIEGIGYSASDGKLVISGENYQSKMRQFLSVDLNTGAVSTIAKMKRDGNNMTGFSVGKEGDIYLSTTAYKYPYSEDSGKVVKISRR